MDNIAIFVEDDPPPGPEPARPLPGRAAHQPRLVVRMALPDRITISAARLSVGRPRRVRHQVRVTVVHEIAHHFGIEDDRLHELGYG